MPLPWGGMIMNGRVFAAVFAGVVLAAGASQAQSGGCAFFASSSAVFTPNYSYGGGNQPFLAGERLSFRVNAISGTPPEAEMRVDADSLANNGVEFFQTLNAPGLLSYVFTADSSRTDFYIRAGSRSTVDHVFSCQTAPAAITGLDIQTGYTGQAVVITGTNLGAATEVRFGAALAVFRVDSNTQITATAPDHPIGPADVSVLALNGDSPDAGVADDFVFTAAPAPVPTLGEWAMILLGLTLAGSAVLTVRRRRSEA